MLTQDKHCCDAPLVQIAEEFMHLEKEVLLSGHRLQIGIQAIDHEKRRPVLLDGGSGSIGKLSRRQLGWVHLLDLERTALNVGSYVDAECGAAGQQRSKPLIETGSKWLSPRVRAQRACTARR